MRVGSAAFVIRQHFFNRVPGRADDDGIGLQVVGESDQRDGERQATSSRSGRVVHVDVGAERVSTLTAKQVPGRE